MTNLKQNFYERMTKKMRFDSVIYEKNKERQK
jgi:hypothetical protein